MFLIHSRISFFRNVRKWKNCVNWIENKKKKMLDETTLSMQTTQQNMEKMKTQVSAFRAKCRALLTSQMRLLDDMVIDEESAVSDGNVPAEQPEADAKTTK